MRLPWTMRHYPDDYIRAILENVKSIAIVGASQNDVRPSFFVTRYLIEKGYRVFPVNPGFAGQLFLGQQVYGRSVRSRSASIWWRSFAASEYAPAIVAEALALDPKPGVIWMQLGVRNDEAAAAAEAAGLKVVMNRCPKIEYGRLSGEIGWAGVNSRVLSSKKPILRTGFQHRGLRRE